MNKRSLNLILSSLVILLSAAIARADFSYSNAVMALNPVAYWPLDETTQPPPIFLAANSGTLGAQANGFYKTTYFLPGGSSTYTFFSDFSGNSPVAGATSDGDAAAQFNGGANANDNTGYMEIPDVNHDLDHSVPFTAEAWVMPGGGDPNDPSGTSFASTEWTAIIKKGGGGAYYTENGDQNNQNTYGWTVALAGKYVLGYPVGWYGGTPYTGPLQLQTNACWVVDFYDGGNGNNPSLEFDVPMNEPTPQWFHLVLTYDGTNAFFYTNGVLAATTVLGTPASTNQVFAANQAPITSPSGAYQFSTNNGVGYAPDTLNPMVIGNINEIYSIINQGYPQANAIGMNCQSYNGALDEVAVYTNALSAAAVLKHYQDATAVNTTLYTNDVFSANPIVYLRLDEPASTFAPPPTDFSTYPIVNNYGSMGSAGDGLYQPGTAPGVSGAPVGGFGSQSSAVQFNGFDSAVDIGNGGLQYSGLDPLGAQPFSVAYWFKANPSDCYRRFQGILGRGDSGWRSSLDNGGHLRWNPGAGPELASPGDYNDGAWHFAVGVSDGTNDYLYVDGQLSTSGNNVGSLGGSSDDLLIGGAPDYTPDYSTTAGTGGNNQRYFAGQVAQVAFFDSALNSSQIQALYSAAGVSPSISQNPQNVSIALGGSGSLTANATGSTPLAYQWYQGPTQLSDVAGNIIGSTTGTLTITNAQLSNGGNYTVVATNNYGAVTSAVAVVTIVPAPHIVSQPSPASTKLYEGAISSVGFSVGVIGASPLSYQWYQGASPVGGATASNIVVSTTSLGTETYHCVITNTYGAVTSSVVTVSVLPINSSTAFTVNLNDYDNFAQEYGNNQFNPYVGPGAYPGSTTSDFWNGFGLETGGFNPYPATGLLTDSTGVNTAIGFTIVYDSNNGGLYFSPGPYQGTPGFLFGEAAIASGSDIGTLTFTNVYSGTYNLYLYAANFDGTRGALFTVSSGGAVGGTNAAKNPNTAGGNGPLTTFGLGVDYVEFTNVTPDVNGNITVTWAQNVNDNSGGGEGDFNGASLVRVVAPATQLSIHLSGQNAILSWSPTNGVLQSATSVNGPYSDISGSTSPYTNSVSGTQQFFRVRQ